MQPDAPATVDPRLHPVSVEGRKRDKKLAAQLLGIHQISRRYEISLGDGK